MHFSFVICANTILNIANAILNMTPVGLYSKSIENNRGMWLRWSKKFISMTISQFSQKQSL